MSDFNPNDEPETQEQADAYVNWCAANFMRLSRSTVRTYRTAVRCAEWLFVVASAQLHLDDEFTDHREELLEQLVNYQLLGRAIERQRQHFPVERLIVLRASLDCWEPVGEWAINLLTASKCAIGALILFELYPLIDLYEMNCEEVWALLDGGALALARIGDGEGPLSFQDYAVRPNELVTARYTWQRANNIVRHVGSGPLSPN